LPAAGDLDDAAEVGPVVPFDQIDMIARGEAKIAQRAFGTDHDIAVLVRADWGALPRNVGKAQQHVAKLGFLVGDARFEFGSAGARFLGAAAEFGLLVWRRGLEASGNGVALGPQTIDLGLGAAHFAFEGKEGVEVDRDILLRRGARDEVAVCTEEGEVQHGAAGCFSSPQLATIAVTPGLIVKAHEVAMSPGHG
jgi:hypothetical protein